MAQGAKLIVAFEQIFRIDCRNIKVDKMCACDVGNAVNIYVIWS